jgi:hypothetical protein
MSASAFGEFTSVSPGSWIEIYGSNLASDTRGWTTADFTGNTGPTSLDGTSRGRWPQMPCKTKSQPIGLNFTNFTNWA